MHYLPNIRSLLLRLPAPFRPEPLSALQSEKIVQMDVEEAWSSRDVTSACASGSQGCLHGAVSYRGRHTESFDSIVFYFTLFAMVGQLWYCVLNCIWGFLFTNHIHNFIIPLCSNKLRILHLYRGCSICAIPALFDVTRSLSCREVDKKAGSQPSDGVYSPIFAYFRVFWPYFRVNSVDKSYRKAIINYLRENNAK